VESTINFARGLRAAYKELEAEGKLSQQDRQAVGQLLDRPVMQHSGQTIFAMKRVHARVRMMYCRQQSDLFAPLLFVWPAFIDWESLVEWFKDNWLDVLKIILTILPFFIL
jgi:hypothetical protein